MHLDSLTVLLAQTGGAPVQQQSPWGMLPFLILIGIMMYFMIIRPQQQRTKQQARLLDALKAGDRVVTSAGIVGTVITVKDKTTPPSVSIRSADAKFEVTKASIAEILPASTTES